ncbi:hypothetical protein HanHA300_Chr00c0306g0741951 [Helianthus annuus]|nr:hypothetical protein HanIR_Chr14g0672331 [Helianthus annuus]KAJ0484115.1 hypothetical protein HanHA89_Chr14g0540581 [Helianthus annuus]KAJ0630348.1 hypothetical protein HanHA300_Chr00c0306g0741951 [Helianthus annuus]KAJ0654697.1 hypothetical protein HanLR1_Chr14g0510091 [Helianthus annuus]
MRFLKTNSVKSSIHNVDIVSVGLFKIHKRLEQYLDIFTSMANGHSASWFGLKITPALSSSITEWIVELGKPDEISFLGW